MSYHIETSPSASDSLVAVPYRAYSAVDKTIRLLATTPELGREYTPSYDAAPPPVPLRVIYSGNYGIYYTVDHAKEFVYVEFVEDQRMDPETRFANRLSKGR